MSTKGQADKGLSLDEQDRTGPLLSKHASGALCRNPSSGGWQERALRAGELFRPFGYTTVLDTEEEESTAGSIS